MNADFKILREMRTSVLKQLESLRVNKEIGKALDAFVAVQAHTSKPEYTHALSKLSREQLAELFGVSRAEPATYSANPGHALPFIAQVIPFNSEIPKCDRCWRHVPDVGDDTRYPTVCLRCAQALDAIDFPPYPAPSPSANN
jgi:isoleucyl-tRNA synthetase